MAGLPVFKENQKSLKCWLLIPILSTVETEQFTFVSLMSLEHQCETSGI